MVLEITLGKSAGVNGNAAASGTVSDGSSGELSAVTAVDLPAIPRLESSLGTELVPFKATAARRRSKTAQHRRMAPLNITRWAQTSCY